MLSFLVAGKIKMQDNRCSGLCADNRNLVLTPVDGKKLPTICTVKSRKILLDISALTSRSASAYELMSVRMTSTCFPHSYAKYSAVVRAILGVIIRSMVGSFAYEQKKGVISGKILQNP
jgi:hypothetical protein